MILKTDQFTRLVMNLDDVSMAKSIWLTILIPLPQKPNVTLDDQQVGNVNEPHNFKQMCKFIVRVLMIDRGLLTPILGGVFLMCRVL